MRLFCILPEYTIIRSGGSRGRGSSGASNPPFFYKPDLPKKSLKSIFDTRYFPGRYLEIAFTNGEDQEKHWIASKFKKTYYI